MRYRLRTLLVLLAIGPPFLAGGWWTRQRIAEYYRKRELELSKQQADFDDLIQLIQTTITPESWDAVGGPGPIDEFTERLTLITGPGQTVHEQPESEK